MINNQDTEPNSIQFSVKSHNSIALDELQNFGWSKSLTLKTKTTLLAIAIGILPTIFTGFIAYQIADNAIKKQIYQNQQNDSKVMLNRVQDFLKERYQDIQIIANVSIFKDANLRNRTTEGQKSLELTNFAQNNAFYESIIFLDLKGNALAVSKGITPGNHFDDDYFQSVIKTGKPFISQPRFSDSVGEKVIYFAAPVKDSVTNELVGVVRSRMPVKHLAEVVQNFGFKYDSTYHVADRDGIVFITNDEEGLDAPAEDHLPAFPELRPAGEIKTLEFYESIEKRDVVGSYVPNQFEGEFLALGWDGFIFAEQQIAYRVQSNFRKVLIVGIITTVVLVTIISISVANQLIKPIIKAASTIEKIGQGDLEQRLDVDSSDEVATLSSNINLMAQQIQTLLQDQKNVAQQQRREKEQLETAIYTLINEVSDATEGDLTVRANLDSLELSTVADLFNAIIDNLQEIAIATKQSTRQVGSSLKQNEEAIRTLAEQAIAEAKETRDTLVSVEQMSESIQAVAENAGKAEKIVDDTYNTIVYSTDNMDLTVDSILNLRTTVGETAKKMKRLGESSEKISQALSLIQEIALKTNVLAINASAEARRAGEYGQGFTIIAKQVGALAEQSAAATKEIASIVAAIQAETQEVNQAMESGTAQVVETTHLVKSTKESLGLVLEKSQEINLLMSSISQTTVSQANTSQNVTNLMQKIAQLSETTSISSEKVARSIVETAQVAQKLESTVAQFKVAESM